MVLSIICSKCKNEDENYLKRKKLWFTQKTIYQFTYSLREINNMITNSSNITLRRVNVKPYGLDETYVNKKLIEDTFYQIIDQFSERNIHLKQDTSIL